METPNIKQPVNQQPAASNSKQAGKEKKWLLWGLLGFTVILLLTAVVLFFQLRKPAPVPSPMPKPKASVEPQTVPVQEVGDTANPKGLCELRFTVAETLSCVILTKNVATPKLDSPVIYTCKAQFSSGSPVAYFQHTIANGEVNEGFEDPKAYPIDPITRNASKTMKVDKVGTWTVKCRICADNTKANCTDWDPVNPDGAENACSLNFVIKALASPSPSPEPVTCFEECTDDSSCDDNLKCIAVSGDKRCVNPSCTDEPDCTCPEEEKVCFDKCDNDDQCPNNLKCMTFPDTEDTRCLNASCTDETDCSCTIAAASPSPSTPAKGGAEELPEPSELAQTKGGQPELPQAGSATGVVFGVSIGLLLILGALLF